MQQMFKPLPAQDTQATLAGPWSSIAVTCLLCALGAWLCAPLAVRFLLLLSRQSPAPWNTLQARKLRAPLALTLGAGGLLAAWPWTQGLGGADGTGLKDLHHDLRGILLVGAFWTVARVVSVASHAAAQSTLADSKPHLVPLSEFVARILRVGVVLVGAITLLGEFGFPVASLLAGVGVGGIAVALAAQKTVENLFGSISILVDAPFRVGDRVSFDGVTGAVLNVGLRSTRLRTDDQRLIVMPNGKLADMRIENLSTLTRPL